MRISKVAIIGMIIGVAGMAIVFALLQQTSQPQPKPPEPISEIPYEEPLPSKPLQRPVEDMIHVYEPIPNTEVKSPLIVRGEARGNWYFEASFPIRLIDANGKERAIAVAQAKGEWMTEEFVPFEATLTFSRPSTATGTLVLQKDNPSGLSEHDAELGVPVRFSLSEPSSKALQKKPMIEKREEKVVQANTCIISGCSSQICSDKNIMTTCEFRAEYACYQSAKCERQTDGGCGWTVTAELQQCLARANE